MGTKVTIEVMHARDFPSVKGLAIEHENRGSSRRITNGKAGPWTIDQRHVVDSDEVFRALKEAGAVPPAGMFP